MEKSKFENLPNEILLKIFYNNYISAEDLFSLSNVCKKFENVCCSEEKLWKSKFVQRYPLAWKKIDSGSRKNTLTKNWKKTLEIALKTEEILSSLSGQSYKFKSIPSSLLSSVYKLLHLREFESLCVLDELRRERKNLTLQYYANELFYRVRYYFSSVEIKEFLNLPPEKQTLEKGVYYVIKGVNDEEFQYIDYEEVSSKLDKLALEVQSYLRTKHPDHPAVSIQLFSPEESFENSKWSEEETRQLIECLNHILRSKHSLGEIDDIQNDIFQNFIEKSCAKDNYFSIIYQAVSHRLGIPLQLILCGLAFLFEVKSSYHPENFVNISEILNPFEEIVDEDDFDELVIIPDNLQTKRIMLLLANFETNPILVERFTTDLRPEIISTLCTPLLLFCYAEDLLDIFYVRVMGFCLKRELYLEGITEICENMRNKIRGSKEMLDQVNSISSQAQNLLEAQRQGPKVITPKIRGKGVDVKFATGMIVTYKKDSSPGVILGWDQNYHPNIDLESQYNVSFPKYNKYKFDQPFYMVLFSGKKPRYEAQEVLSLKREPVPIKHFQIGKYFKRFNGNFYEPNKELCSEYPDDELVRNELYSVNTSEFNKK